MKKETQAGKAPRKTAKGEARSNAPAVKKLSLLVLVCERQKTDYYEDVLQMLGANMELTVFGRGTAKTETPALLGLVGTDKAVLFAVVKKAKETEIVSALDERFHKIRGGGGVCFCVPLSSVIGVLSYAFLSDNQKAVKGG